MTNTNMEIFNNEEFGEVRAIVINGEPWFVGRDVANRWDTRIRKTPNNAHRPGR